MLWSGGGTCGRVSRGGRLFRCREAKEREVVLEGIGGVGCRLVRGRRADGDAAMPKGDSSGGLEVGDIVLNEDWRLALEGDGADTVLPANVESEDEVVCRRQSCIGVRRR